MEIEGQRDLLLFIVQLFSRHHIEYLLTGSFAVSYYGVPRATHDIDFIVDVRKDSLKRLEIALKTLGKEFLTNMPPADGDASMFQIYHLKTGIKVDFWIMTTQDFQMRMKRKHDMSVGTHIIHVISAEDLILNKLVWCKEVMSERHMQDCKGMWNTQGEKLNKAYLQKRAKELHITELLRAITKSSL